MSSESSKYTQQGEWALNPTISRRRVVVTGIGMITPLGDTTDSTWENLIAGRSGITSLDPALIAGRADLPKLSNPTYEARVGGELEVDFDFLGSYVSESIYLSKEAKALYKAKHEPIPGSFNKKDVNKMSRATLLGLAASVQAANNAGILKDGKILPTINPEELGVVIGTCIGGMNNVAVLYERLINNQRISPYDALITGLERVSTATSIAFYAKGPVETPTVACATGSLALIRAYQDIALGDSDIMIAGGTDTSLDPISLSMFDTIRALSRPRQENEDPRRASRPFDRQRNGFVMAEGAGILILESEEHALKRGANILAEFAGYGKNSDAGHETHPNGLGAKNSMRKAFARAGLPDTGIIYFNAHGTGTSEGDGVEIKANREVLEELPNKHEFAISSTKSAMGHTMGASGAIEAGVAIMALRENVLPPTINLDEVMEEGVGINLVPNDAQEKEVGMSISGNFGFGGVGSAIAFKPYCPR